MKLALQTLAPSLFGLAFFGVAAVRARGTFNYWQAWVFIAVFTRPRWCRASIWR